MRFPTEIRVKTTKRSEAPSLRFVNGIVALTINREGHLGYYHNGTFRWYSEGNLLTTAKEPKPRHITLPHITVVGTDNEILEQIQQYAEKLIGFTFGSTGSYPEGTLYLLDLWGESNASTGTSCFDVALVVSTATFDWTGARKAPSYLGWTCLEIASLPEVVRKSRYQREPVI